MPTTEIVQPTLWEVVDEAGTVLFMVTASSEDEAVRAASNDPRAPWDGATVRRYVTHVERLQSERMHAIDVLAQKVHDGTVPPACLSDETNTWARVCVSHLLEGSMALAADTAILSVYAGNQLTAYYESSAHAARAGLVKELRRPTSVSEELSGRDL